MMNIHGALARKRQELNENGEKGFTLIELLVVVLIIGILTAIAVPIFIGQQNQAKDAAAKSDLGVAKVAYVSAVTKYDAVPDVDDLKEFGYIKSTEASEVVIAAGSTKTEFCISNTSTSTAAGTPFHIDEGSGALAGGC